MSNSSTNRLRVAVLLDGRPGHEKQTKGILQAMQTMVELEAIPLQIERVGPLTLLWRTILLFLPGKGPSVPSVAKADLLLGTGSQTHLPMLAIKKRYGIPAITCMKPPRHLRPRFDLCFVPEHDGISEQGNIMLTSGAPNCSIDRGRHQAEHGLILLGGIDRKSHDWHSDRICMMVKRIVETESMTHWTISSSPRTPRETVQLLDRLAGEAENVEFFHYKDTKPGWIEEQYERNSVVWVTADSISMVYEALTAGCKVGILPMQWKRKNSKFKKNEDLLVRKGLVVSYLAWVKGGCSWREDIELNEALRCAERILQKWLPKS